MKLITIILRWLTSLLREVNEKKKIDNSKNENLVEVYRDSRNNIYYKWKIPSAMHAMRYLVGWRAIENANMGVTTKDAIDFLNNILKGLNMQDAATAGYYATTFKNRILTADPEKAYLELASCYILINNEAPDKYDPNVAATKQALWETDIEAKAFFLDFAYQLSAILISTSSKDIPNALVNQNMAMGRLLISTLSKLSPEGSTN